MTAKPTTETGEAARYQAQCQAFAVECGYPAEAVMLILHVAAALQRDSEGRNGVTARELCDKLISIASSSYGEGASDALEGWRMTSSEDIGRIVAPLVNAELITLAKGESESSFQDLFTHEDLMRNLLREPAETGSAAAEARARSTVIPRLIESHFQPHGVQSLTITQRTWPYRVRVDLQRAIDRILSTMRVAHFSSARKQYSPEGFHLHDLMLYCRHDNAVAVPCLYEEIDIGDEAPVRCLKNALCFFHPRTGRTSPWPS